MSQPRKSSVDNVRRPKAHIPYRADDLTQGKKTGVNVRVVDRKSDGFESFGEVLTQADVVTPPHLRRRNRGNRTPSPVAEYDENGEISMDVDDPSMDMDTPRMYFNNAPRPSAPSSANRSTASSRPGNRSSLIDYDSIPSPRPSTSTSSHRLRLNGTTTSIGRSKSNLSQVVPSSAEEDDENDKNEDSFGDALTNNNDAFDPSPDYPSPEQNKSFTEMDREEDEPESEPHPRATTSSPPPRRVEKEKGKERTPDDDRVEDEIGRGLDEMEMMNDRDEGVDIVDDPPPKKRGRQAPDAVKPAKRKKVSIELSGAEATNYNEGVRRGTRTRYKPLDWWRCEKVVYGRRDSGVSMVPVIKDIIRVPKEPTQSLVHNKSKGNQKRARSRSKALEEDENREVMVFNPEEGWDDNTDPHGVVLDYVTQEEVRRRVAFTAKMVSPKPAANNEFAFQKIFGDGEFIAAGQLLIPVGGKKPSKGTKDNTYVFYVIEGAVSLKIHRTSFIVATGGMFLIPRGNNYYIENVSQRSAKLFFTQARKVNVEDDAPPDVRPASALRKSVDRLSGAKVNGAKPAITGRSSSAAAISSPDKVKEAKAAASKRAISK